MKKVLLVSILILAISWAIQGVYVTYLLINDEIFDSISPPTALFNDTFLGFFFRLFDPVTYYSGGSLTIAGFIIPILILLFIIFNIFKNKRNLGIKKSIPYLLSCIFLITILNLIFLIVIPGSIEWGTMKAKAAIDTQKLIKIISNKSIITDQKEIFSYIKSNKPIKVYSDYGEAGAILAILIDSKNKFSFYESFYLPLYLSKNKDIEIDKEIGDSNMFMFNNNLIIVGVKNSAELEEIILPVARNLLVNSYPTFINSQNSRLKTFKVIDGEKYQNFYIQKVKSDLEKDIAYNQQMYENNNKIINNYQDQRNYENEQYRKYVVEDGLKYENGCVKSKIYNDCEEFKNLIEENKKIIEKNKVSIEVEYKNAIKYNLEIQKVMADQEKQLSNISNGSNSLENNKGEYSVGVTFNNDVIYLRFFKENPINSEILRVMIHELLHSYSYNSNRTIHEPINEGITDYLALQSMGLSDIDIIRAAGYPIETQIILALLEKIKKEDLIKIYFDGKEENLKKLITDNFPNVDYLNFKSKTKEIFEKTYRVNGLDRNFDKALIDHEEVREIRKILNLPEKKFEFDLY